MINKPNQIRSICGRTYDGWGNNAQPINAGRCCDECNVLVVARRFSDIRRYDELRRLDRQEDQP